MEAGEIGRGFAAGERERPADAATLLESVLPGVCGDGPFDDFRPQRRRNSGGGKQGC